MNIEQIKSALEVSLKADQPTILWGQTGVGKSTIISEVCLGEGETDISDESKGGFKQANCTACEDGIPHRWHLIDLRLGQLDSGDLVGLPRASTDGTATTWLKGDWWPKQGLSAETGDTEVCGVVFVDELNRASTPDVLQASFQLILPPHRIHTHRLPKGWRVLGACNPPNGSYQVCRLDPAYTARFLHIFVKADKQSWAKWAKGKNLPTPLIDYALKTKNIFRDEEMPTLKDLGVGNNPRSWTLLAPFHTLMSRKEVESWGVEFFSGLVGREIAEGYVAFYLAGDCFLGGRDILGEYQSIKPKVQSWVAEKKFELIGVALDSLQSCLKDNPKLTKKEWTNLGDFLKDIPVEVGMGIVKSLESKGLKKLADEISLILPHPVVDASEL